MNKIMLDLTTLAKHAGLVQDMLEKLGGKNGVHYERKLKMMLRGEDRLSLPSLTHKYTFEELIKRTNIYGFFGNIAGLGVVKPSGKTLTMPHPKPLGKATTEREMLRRFPGCKDLDGSELTLAVKKLIPEREVLLAAMVNAIIEPEEGRANLIPTAVGTWALGFCVQNGELQILRCLRNSGGWYVDCHPVELGRRRSAGSLLLLATDTYL